jgi:hypothetical protein
VSPARAEAERHFSKVTGGKFDAPRAAPTAEAPAAEPAASPSEGRSPRGSSIVGAVKKLHSRGWGALAPHEKSQLLTGGVGLIGAHRLLTGRDLLTGDNND